MTDSAARAVKRVRELRSTALPAGSRTGAMAVPLAVLLAVACGGWHAVVVQASSVAGLMGR
jgi:hypothetical protein